jgi:hypothetical protein
VVGSEFRGKPSSAVRRTKWAWHFVVNGISGDHRRYLALGGLGFLLGDGAVNYGLADFRNLQHGAHLAGDLRRGRLPACDQPRL